MSEQVRMLEAYFRLMNLHGASQVYAASVGSGLLDALAPQPRTAASLAEACGTAERPTRLLLDVLETLGMVEARHEAYRLTPLARVLLQGSYRNLGGEYWAHLPQLLATGEPLKQMDDPSESERHYQAQAQALAWMLAPAAEAASRLLGIGGERKGCSILDVGAGSGIWSLTMARNDPAVQVTAVDWPAVLQIAKATAAKFDVDDRLTTVAGNFHEVELAERSFDLAIVGNVCHLESPEGNAALFSRLHRSLRPGGSIVVIDVFSGDPQGDLNRTLYELGLALRTRAGRVYEPAQIQALLGEAGYGSTELIHLPVPPHTMGLVVAAA